jgi:hypothetical protein
MKPLFAAATLALGLCSCSESAPVVQILQTIKPNASCAFASSDLAQANGSLNLNYGSSYVLGLIIRSSYDITPIDVNGVPLDPEGTESGSSVAFVDTLELSYASTANVSLPDQKVPYALAVRPAANEARLAVNLMTAEIANALRPAVAAGAQQVRVTFKLTGKFASGNRKFETNEVIYGIDVSAMDRSAALPVCEEGELPSADGPCGTGAGQDGLLPSCRAGAAAPPGGG